MAAAAVQVTIGKGKGKATPLVPSEIDKNAGVGTPEDEAKAMKRC